MGNYQTQDEDGRQLFHLLCSQQKWCRHKKDSTNKYSSWDLSYLSGKTRMIGEIKYRREYEGDEFYDWILELEKLNNLKKIHEKMLKQGIETRITYINHFNANYTLIWDITDLNLDNYQIKKVKLQKNNFDTTEIWKDVIYLPSYQAIFRGETDETKSIFIKQLHNGN
jgi:hypothetical protein